MLLPDDVVTAIRAVALSKVGGVPLKNFLRDYKELNGKALQPKEYKFKTLTDLMDSIPMVVRLAQTI